MQKITIILTTIVLAANGLLVRGQVSYARKEMALYDFSRAIALLQKPVNSKDPGVRREAFSLLAECYRMQNDPARAAEMFKKAVDLGANDSQLIFHFAQSLRSTGKYPEAKKLFLESDSLSPAGHKGSLFASFCDSAQSWQAHPKTFTVKNVRPLNSPQSDFGLIPYKGHYLFVSDRLDPQKDERSYGWTGNSYLGLFLTDHLVPGDPDSGFSLPAPFSDLRARDWHNGPVSFNRDYTMAFLNTTSVSGDKGKKEGQGIRTHLLHLYFSKFEDDKWSEPESFFLNGNDYSVGHPALSPDGKSLYFVSDMPGGCGGTDLYLCRMESGKWSAPENLGPVVNSAGNEMFPFVCANGDLCFSSDGLPGFGGLDIFLTKYKDGIWSRPENQGMDLNSSYDDFSFTTPDDCKTGYFSSNRPAGSGNDDIYSFLKLPPPSPPSPPFISGYVKEKTTRQPISGATVFLLDKEKEEILVLKTDEQGYYRTEIRKGAIYLAKAVKPLYLPDCLSFRIKPEESAIDFSVPRDLLLDELAVGRKFILENIFYDFDKWNIRKDAEPALDQLASIMKNNPVNVELGSHTDCRGSVEYNLELSRKRAESAVDYIIRKGIDPARITARGYGKSRLINQCDCSEGIFCTEAEHQANRRTEFLITGITERDSGLGFDPGKFSDGEKIRPDDLPSGFFSDCIK